MEIIAVNDLALVKKTAELAKEIWNEHFVPMIGQAQVDYMLDQFQSIPAISDQIEHGYRYFLVNENKQLAGYFAVLVKESEGELFLSKFYLKSSHRGKGLGRKMFEFIEKLALKEQLCTITLTTNKKNFKTIEIYKKLGFQVTNSPVTDIGQGFVMDDYRMAKHL